jgi:ribonucleoside-triphosphate reductase
VSATISLKEDEWDKAGEWMWNNRDCYNGLSVLPYDGGTYTQAPFEDVSEDEYNERMKHLSVINLENVVEMDDNTDLSGELACAGGSCEVTNL